MSRYGRSDPVDCSVFVGGLRDNGSKHDLEYAFGYYGPIRSVWLARNPPGFAFVQFEDARDAKDAVRGLDGEYICGCRVTVALKRGNYRNSNRQGSRNNRDDRCYECGERGHFARDCTFRRRRVSRSRSPYRRPRGRSHSRSTHQSASRSPVARHMHRVTSGQSRGSTEFEGPSAVLNRSQSRSPRRGTKSRSRNSSPSHTATRSSAVRDLRGGATSDLNRGCRKSYSRSITRSRSRSRSPRLRSSRRSRNSSTKQSPSRSPEARDSHGHLSSDTDRS